jgi:hypothetical protein
MGVAAAALGSAVGFAACGRPIHPNDETIPEQLCRPRCQREHDCNAEVDVPACVSRCEHFTSPRAIYDRTDYVAAMRACAQGQSCVADVDLAIGACQGDAFRRFEPSPADHEYCARRVEREIKCGDFRRDAAHCENGTKMYSDAILGQLTDCLDQPCRMYGRCILAVVGEDPMWDDPDRWSQYAHTPLPDAGPASVTLSGIVTMESNGPLVDVNVCLLALKGSCVKSTESGAFSLQAPAHAELALTFVAPGFGSTVVGFVTRGRDTRSVVVLHSDAGAKARYAAIGATYPNETAGFLFATVRAPAGSEKGLSGITVQATPKPGQGPLYFAETSAPDPARTDTSTWSSAAFAGVEPGELTVTFGPASVTCVPAFGAWPSTLPNAVRVPVAAGFETRVFVQCHM